MKQWKAVWFLMAAFVLAATMVHAFDFGIALPPKPQGFINDFASAIPAERKQQLEMRLAGIQKKGLATITVLVVKNLNGNEIAEYSINVADVWKVGKKGVDNGVLITIATEERGKNGKPGRRRIEVGRGLNGVLTDMATGRILKASRESFDKGDVVGSLNQITDSIEGLLAKEKASQPPVVPSQSTGEASKSSPKSDLSGIFIYGLIALMGIIVLALGGNWVIKQINRNREKKQAEQNQQELLKVYGEAAEEIGKLCCNAVKVSEGLPQLAKSQGEQCLTQIRRTMDEVNNAKRDLTAKDPIFSASRNPADLGRQLKKLIAASKLQLDKIEKLPFMLEQSFTEAGARIAGFDREIEKADKAALQYRAEGFVIDTKPLKRFESEVAELKAVMEKKKQHPDDINWKYFDDHLGVAKRTIEEPKKNLEQAAKLIAQNGVLFTELSRMVESAAAKLSKLQSENPADVWRELPQKLHGLSGNFSIYIALNSSALKESVISSGVADFGYGMAEEAKKELEKVKSFYEELDELEVSLEKARNEHAQSCTEAERSYHKALSAVKADGVKDATAGKVKRLEEKLASAKKLSSQAGQGGMVNMIVLMALIAEVASDARRIAREAEEEANTHQSELRRQARLLEERREAERREERRSVIAVDDDDTFSRSRGGGGEGISFDSTPEPDSGGDCDGSGADD
ncbi:hypothetical protein HGA34_01525 [Candidatus Falkowbacteria bacterium]|nr:hypothetical protein [Candidatus Falkowbacteria bacterium]